MANLTNKNKIALEILKGVDKDYNANSLAKVLKISSMGCLKILKQLEDEGIIKGRHLGKAVFYKPSFSSLSESYFLFLLNAEKENMPAYAMRWIREIEKIKGAQIAILFGSVLAKGEKARDIDVIFVVQPKNLLELKKEVGRINSLAEKKIHPIYQTISDFKKNIKERNPAILEAVKCLILTGQDKFISIVRGEQ